MSNNKKQVLVTINEREYLVEVGDLSSTPTTAIVDGKTYQIQVQFPKVTDQSTAPTTIGISSPASQPNHSIISVDAVIAPMPGDIVDILVKPGEKVVRGQELCVLEAMKMKNSIRSPQDGRIKSIDVVRHQKVAYGDVLLRFE